MARVHRPAATAAAAPPLEPPGERDVSQGLRVMPNARVCVTGITDNSGIVVLPRMIAPASRKRAVTGDSCVHCVRHLDRRDGAGTVSGREFVHRAETQRVIARIVKPLVHRSVIAQSSLDCHSTDTYAPPRYACQTAGSPASAVAVSDFTTSPDSIT